MKQKQLTHSVSLDSYISLVKKTNKFSPDKTLFGARMGLFSEVGSLVSLLKKKLLDQKSKNNSNNQVIEEMGDIFWYFTLMTIDQKISILELLNNTANSNEIHNELLITGIQNKPFVVIDKYTTTNDDPISIFNSLVKASSAVSIETTSETSLEFLYVYLKVMNYLNLNLLEVIESNRFKIENRFIPIGELKLPELLFDADYSKDEQLPINFEVHIVEKPNGKAYLKWNDVFIGSALNDNHKDDDNYKYHDVFHLAFTAILHWSPTFRALIKHKRKSNPTVDETEDSGRPIVIEEGLSAWLFSMSKEEGVDFTKESDISYDLLKTIQVFVRGYEVEECPLQLWVSAINQGYSVFNQVVENQGGVIVGDRKARTLKFKKLSENQ